MSEGWTQENLLAEAENLIDEIAQEADPEKVKQMDGCFMAVQEVMLLKHQEAETNNHQLNS